VKRKRSHTSNEFNLVAFCSAEGILSYGEKKEDSANHTSVRCGQSHAQKDHEEGSGHQNIETSQIVLEVGEGKITETRRSPAGATLPANLRAWLGQKTREIGL
jgi:hypothetical protein